MNIIYLVLLLNLQTPTVYSLSLEASKSLKVPPKIAQHQYQLKDTITKRALDSHILDYNMDPAKNAGLPTTRHLRLKDILPTLSKETNSLAALKSLKSKFPDLFEDYLLIYKSRSLQQATFQKPRVVLFSGSARLAIAYADLHTNLGADNIELMEFDPIKLKFNFQEISYFNGRSVSSELNPKKCMTCHQANTRKNVDMRPNWEPYNVWPGVYASSIRPKHDKKLGEDHSKENTEYKKFMLSTQERYQLLPPYKKLSNGQYVSASSIFGRVTTNIPLRLTRSFSNLNLHRVARLIKEDPAISYLQSPLLAALKCKTLYMPEEHHEWHKAHYNRTEISLPIGNLFKNTPASVPSKNEFKIASISWLISFLFEPLGRDTTDWSMDFGTSGSFAFTHRFGTPGAIDKEMLNIFAHVWGKNNYLNNQLNCDQLKKISIESFHRKQLPNFKPAITRTTSLKQNCISCHSSTNHILNGAPWIPFDETKQLKKKLQSSLGVGLPLLEKIKVRLSNHADFKTKMPPNELSLRDDDVARFIKELEELTELEKLTE